MQNVFLLQDHGKHKAGETIRVTERHAHILFKHKVAEKEHVKKDGKKEDKTAATTKENKSAPKTKAKK